MIWKEKHEELDSEKVKCNRVVMIEEKQISVVSRYAKNLRKLKRSRGIM